MELLPVLGPQDKPSEGLWYVLVPRREGPGVSVGHTCTYTPSEDGGRGKVLIVGGANPSGSFSESNVINLDSHEWDIPDWEGLEARYEHCSFVPETSPQCLWVFAGAQQNGNRNCIQNLQLTDSVSRWRSVEAKGTPPCPRTYHTSSACVGDRLYVFSGGEAGAAPVSDPKLHVFDAVSSTWSQPDTPGRHPPARHGHVIVAVGSKIYIHGGMAGDKLHSDMYSLDTSSMKWEKVSAKGDIPPGVASHSAVALGNNIYIFGGMTAEGASNTMHRFHTDKRRWVLMKFKGDLPPNRLDHSMCVLPWRVRAEGSGEGDQAQGSAAPAETVQLEGSGEGDQDQAQGSAAPAETVQVEGSGEGDQDQAQAQGSAAPAESVQVEGSGEGVQAQGSAAPAETVQLAFIFGGMDTHGVLHNDCVVTLIT